MTNFSNYRVKSIMTTQALFVITTFRVNRIAIIREHRWRDLPRLSPRIRRGSVVDDYAEYRVQSN